ncbi:ISPs1a-2, partial [Pseudomonas syringae pv. solidagae]
MRYVQPEPPQASGKGGPEEPLDHALGRSRGGLTTKIHMVCDANGVPLRFMLSPGQANDIAHAQPLLDQVQISGKPGRPRKRSRWLLADKGYDAEHLRYCDRYRIQPVIPLRAMPRKPRPGLPRLFDRPKYRQRNIIERMFGWLKENRRIGTRYDKLAKSYAAMVTLACSLRCMRQYFSYKTYGYLSRIQSSR